MKMYKPSQHPATTVPVSAVVVIPPQAEFSLGRFDRSSVEGLGENLIRQGQEQGEEGAIVLEVKPRFAMQGWCYHIVRPRNGHKT